jgi:hypothetical protein
MVRVDSPLVSTLLVPTTALAVALGPAVMPSPAAAPAVPVVQVEAIQLAGIGQNIYNAITPVVQYAVGGVSYVINFLPLGGIVAAQINIDYFQGIQPAVAATVNYAAAVLQDPLDFFPITRAYVNTLVDIQYNLVSAQLRFLGFNELPPRPAAGRKSGARAAAAATAPSRISVPVVGEQADEAPAAPQAPGRTTRSARAANDVRERGRLIVRPGASAKPTEAAAKSDAGQARGSVETRRQKSTTGRSRSAI